jgi:protoporphyrinogen/coproporphyrinogen III oxidase
MKKVIVIGGGITGLAAAWKIRQAHHAEGDLNLEVLEASSRVGGALKSARRDGFLLEMGPDCFISDKPRGIGLCKELGLEGELIGTRPGSRRSYIYRAGKFHPIPEGFYLLGPSKIRPFLRSGLLSWRAKIRAALEPLIPSRPQTDESLAAFVRRRFGQELLDYLAQPLVAGIYGASPDHLSLRATFPQFLEMERTYGSIVFGLRKRPASTRSASGARYSLFVTLRSGLQSLTDELARRLGPAVVRRNARVASLRQGENQWDLRLNDGELLSADTVCLAMPADAAADLVRPFDDELAGELSGIEYRPSATLNFAFRESDVKKPLSGVGFVVPQKEERLILGCSFVHQKFDGRVPPGFHLVRAFLGGVDSNAWTGADDETLARRVLAELTEWLGIQGVPLFTHVERYGGSLPQFSVGHLPRVLRIEERLFNHPGLALAGNWQYGVGIPDCIESGERAADQIISYLRRPAPVAW